MAESLIGSEVLFACQIFFYLSNAVLLCESISLSIKTITSLYEQHYCVSKK